MVESTLVRSLDIWGIVENEFPYLKEYAIEDAVIYLNIEGESFIDVHYYDIGNPDYVGDEPLRILINLTIENINKLYSEIFKMVDLPYGVKSLLIKMKEPHEVPSINVALLANKAR